MNPSSGKIGSMLRALREADAIGELDAHFAAFICRSSDASTPALALAAALTSRATAQGHVCIDLARHAGQRVGEADSAAPPLAAWLKELAASAAVAQAGERRPLVLEGTRLYLYRYWQYERDVAEQLLARAALPSDMGNEAAVRAALDRWFPAGTETDWQKVAAARAATAPLTIISGGPGTGKTTTVMRALAILAETAVRPLRMALAAPTGKAAARLQEALRQARAALQLAPAIDAQLPREAATLHRLLGVLPGRTRFKHNRAQPLPLDVLVVDEASMIDLALMAKLLDALPPHARLIVLGDKDQLASVEAGAVMHSICAGPDVYSRATAERLRSLTGHAVPAGDVPSPLADTVVRLRKRYRFAGGSAIAALADTACSGNADAALQILADARGAELTWHGDGTHAALIATLADRYEALLRMAQTSAEPDAVYALLRMRGVLCAHRVGAHGASTLNRAVENELRRRGLIVEPGAWFRGRPVIIARNDYAARLYNGDLGVTLIGADGRIGVYFPDENGRLRRFAPARLPECDSAFAMTVHKAQGSEFDAVDFVLPRDSSPVLTRELFYTAVTRATRSVEVWGAADVVRASLTARVVRDSALVERLWPAPSSVPPAQGVLF